MGSPTAAVQRTTPGSPSSPSRNKQLRRAVSFAPSTVTAEDVEPAVPQLDAVFIRPSPDADASEPSSAGNNENLQPPANGLRNSAETEKMLAELMVELDNYTEPPDVLDAPRPTVLPIEVEVPYVPHPAIEGPPPLTEAEVAVMRMIADIDISEL
eukprot:CAMPEP_0174842848 /NCGR_PEP_ID=MMETSP1114-20130205/10157_1 /TAXON_ID=312471 /ORGANISM="Neobodo designis, Strain CCAP 1951/1" /LENGTH=154 /DNA_ID=CAMNT_0016077059 /DNA_START=1 /DNA_END=465 /DNA_ORIENTATION=+